MKKNSAKQVCMRMFMTCLTVLLTMQAFGAPKSKTVEYPLIEFGTTEALDIAKVELTKKAAVLYMDANAQPHTWIRIAADSYLKADGKKYMLIGAEGIQPDSLFWMPKSGKASFSLRFEPMPMDTKAFDFIESGCEECWKLYGIDLTGKKIFDKPEGLPKEVADVALPESVPEPILKCGKTTVRLHLLGYRPEYNINSINIYVNTLLGRQEELEVKMDPKNGEGEVTFLQYGTAYAMVVCDMMSFGNAWLAPGETVDLYADVHSNRHWFNKYDRSGKLAVLRDTSFQSMYTNGMYAGLNKYVNVDDGRPRYSFQLYSGDFADYKMTSAEYADHVISTYKTLTDNVNKYCTSKLDREYQTLSLKQDACYAMSNDFRPHNYSSVHHTWGQPVPTDSIAPLKPEDAQRILSLFDINDPQLLMGRNMMNFFAAVAAPSVDWMQAKNLPDGLIKDLTKVIRFEDKAINAQLTDTDFAELKAMSTPFFYDVFSLKQAEAKRILANTEIKAEQTPDVPVEQLFDAIIAPYKGKVILVDFWNTWCGPCRASIKMNEPLKQGELKSDDLVWIYIADESSPLSTYLSMISNIQGVHYRMNNEQWEYICDKFNIDGIPSYVLVGKDGDYSLRNDLRNHGLLKETLLKALEK